MWINKILPFNKEIFLFTTTNLNYVSIAKTTLCILGQKKLFLVKMFEMQILSWKVSRITNDLLEMSVIWKKEVPTLFCPDWHFVSALTKSILCLVFTETSKVKKDILKSRIRLTFAFQVITDHVVKLQGLINFTGFT